MPTYTPTDTTYVAPMTIDQTHDEIDAMNADELRRALTFAADWGSAPDPAVESAGPCASEAIAAACQYIRQRRQRVVEIRAEDAEYSPVTMVAPSGCRLCVWCGHAAQRCACGVGIR